MREKKPYVVVEFDSREKAKIALEEKKSLTIYLEVILLQAKEIICSCFNI